ncbi:hypothetical protein HOD30_00450 [Candidatus Peregrinibacteria bacterium]|jgi:hypothetical protein|nr:hypothetical protein [Candidatus Peregrinibacteria bacterium]MBT4631987.1 hypothetical protein [Candidatus Peregrinibacteria bacterium]MBT5516409.1 hypothetical protein [Candidatus Peregrinibacteria bacterium]MBT5823810.1 hypothetical protein [Candidatus Peregrinibacteria bacterium]
MEQAGYIVLGSFLALITSFISENYRSWSNKKNQRGDLKISLRLEFKVIIELIDKIVEKFGTSQFFDIRFLKQLKSAIDRLEKLRDHVIFINNEKDKEKILATINAVAIYQSDALSLEGQAFKRTSDGEAQGEAVTWNHENYRSQRQLLATRSVDLKRRIEEVIHFTEGKGY